MYVEKFAARFVMNDKSAQVSAMFHNQRWLFRDLVSIVNYFSQRIASIIEKWRIHPYAVRGSLKDQGFAAAYRDHAILSGSGQAYAAHAGHHNRCVLWNDKPWYPGSIRGRIVAGVYRRWVIGRLKPSAPWWRLWRIGIDIKNKYTNSSKYASEHHSCLVPEMHKYK